MACSKPVQATLSFAEIIQGRDTSVRVTGDNMLYAVDLAMTVTGKNCNDSNECLRDLSPSLFDKEKFLIRSRSRLISFKNAIELIMVLPGKLAKETRAQLADIIRRYMAGDKTMHAEINANAKSSSPIAQMARESLGLPPVDEALVGFKRRREELELFKMEHEINALIIENKSKALASIISTTTELERIRDPVRCNLDDRTRLMIQDALQNTLGQKQTTITNGPSPKTPISISSVAAELGYKPTTEDSKRIGVDLRKRYLKAHNKPPTKHDQLCGGLVMKINSYTEQDRPLVVEALQAYYQTTDSDSSDSD